MAGSMTTSTISPGITPGMAYRPVNSPSLYGSDIDDDRRWTLSFNLATVFRALVTVAALTAIITWSSMRPVHSTVFGVFVELFIILGWNFVLLLPQSRVTRMLPAVVCQIGDCDCVFNGDDDEEGRPRKPKNKQQKRWKLLFTALVDLVLGLTTTIIMSKSTSTGEILQWTWLTSFCLKGLPGTTPHTLAAPGRTPTRGASSRSSWL
jgi:hypothetical protein